MTDSQHKNFILPRGRTIQYNLVRGGVKNINLRINASGEIRVSAPRFVSLSFIESFLASKEAFILKALGGGGDGGGGGCGGSSDGGGLRELSPAQKKEFEDYMIKRCGELMPVFKKNAINLPEIKFRNMKTQWGSCCKSKNWIHFNYQLYYYPPACQDYVIVHEMAHLIEANHSDRFWAIVTEIMPEWKKYRKLLRKI